MAVNGVVKNPSAIDDEMSYLRLLPRLGGTKLWYADTPT